MLPGIVPVMMMSGPTFPDLQFLGLTTGTGKSVNDIPFGDDPQSNRRVILAIHYASDNTPVDTDIGSVTIGGVSATLHATRSSWHNTNHELIAVAMASAIVPAGTSGTGSITVPNASGGQNISVGSFITYRSLTSISTDTGNSIGGTSANIDLVVPSNGSAIAAASAYADAFMTLNVSGMAGGQDAYDNNPNILVRAGAQFGSDLSASTDNITASRSNPGGLVIAGMAWSPG